MANIQRRDLMKGMLATAAVMAFPENLLADTEATQIQIMETFRQVALAVTDPQFAGAFPTFCFKTHYIKGATFKDVGAVSIKAAFAELHERIPLTELGKNLSVTDFVGRMKATQDYATRKGFLAGFPTFNDDRNGTNLYCRIVLIKNQPNLPGVNPSPVVLRNVPLAELGNVGLNDNLGRLRAATKFAANNKFVGGFPNMYYTNFSGSLGSKTNAPPRIECGTILLENSAAEYNPGVPVKGISLTGDCG